MAAQTLSIALLGAESTGKTWLSQQLAQHWRNAGKQVVLVPEYLRQWCEHAGRTPLPHEQLAIAQEQARQVEAAGPCDVLIADTTALMVAVYSDYVFADTTLYAFALHHQRSYHATLLTGLDLPWVADGLQREGPQVQAPVDALLRTALQDAELPFQTIYGSGQQRFQAALNAIGFMATEQKNTTSIGQFNDADVNSWPAAPWCERCSQPDCEHRLFTRLLMAGTTR